MGLFQWKKKTPAKATAVPRPSARPPAKPVDPDDLSEKQARMMAQALSQYLREKR